jgi:hypothetical protein
VTSLSDQLLAETGLPAEFALDLEPVLTAIRDFLPEKAPAPSPALAALMARPPRPMTSRSRGRLAVLGSAAALMSSLTVTGVAAAANELPDTTQRFVANLSERFLPFQFPQPAEPTVALDHDQQQERVAPSDAVSSELLPPTLQGTAVREETTPESAPAGGPSAPAVVPNTPAPSPSPAVTEPTATATQTAQATASATATATEEATATATATVEATTGTSGDPRVVTDPSPTGSPTADETSTAPSPSQAPSGPTR